MKTVKKATQRNVTLNLMMYDEIELRTMLKNKEIVRFYFDENENFKEDYSEPTWWVWDELKEQLRLFLDDVKEIKVELDEDGHYTTVAIRDDGKKFYVDLVN